MENFKQKTTRISILLLMFAAAHLSALSQGLSVVEDKSSQTFNCIGRTETEACVRIVANKSLELSFSSSVDAEVYIASKTEVGANIVYELSFPTDKIEYTERRLTIRCQLFPNGETISLLLEPKESLIFNVSVSECYKTVMKDAADLFRQSLYKEAKEEYKKAKECFDAPADGEATVKIFVIDSILNWKKQADASFDLLDYREAREYYNKIIKYNFQDQYALNRSKECAKKYDQHCLDCFSKAEVYFSTGEYRQAKILYDKVIKQNCDQKFTANSRLKEMKVDSIKRLDQSTVFTYEYANNVPIGFSIGSYKNKKGGFFITFKSNTAFFNMIRSQHKKGMRHEANLSAGGNFRPVKNKYVPVWINIGLGYTGIGDYYSYDIIMEGGAAKKIDVLFTGGELPEDYRHIFKHAISPEIGLLGKIPFGPKSSVSLALRYTFQYRIALEVASQDYMKPVAHGFGIGICF